LREQILEVLSGVKEKIAVGWHKGSAHNRDISKVCVGFAITLEEAKRKFSYDIFAQTIKILLTVTNCSEQEHMISFHNDDCINSQAEALDWIDRAIKYTKENVDEFV